MTKNVLVAGTDPIALQDYCLQELADHTKNSGLSLSEPAFILVPDALKADIERRYVSNFDVHGLMLAEVLSFQRFAYRIFSIAGGLARESISSMGKSLLIQKIICENPDSFKRFNRFVGKPSYSDELEKVLRDFKRFDLTEGLLEDLANQAPPSLTKDKISDFATLFNYYQKQLDKLDTFDQDDHLTRLIDLLEDQENADLDFLLTSKIWITGFADIRNFNQQELRIIELLSQRIKSLTITNCTSLDEADQIGQEIFEPGLTAYKQLYSRLPRLEVIRLKNQSPRQQRLIQEALLTGKIDISSSEKEGYKNQPAPSIRLLTSENKRQEWSFVAGEIKRLIQEENYRPKEIGIALPSEGSNQSLIKSIFRDFGLSAYLTDRIPIKQLPLYRYLEGFLRLCQPAYQFEDLMLYFRSGLSDSHIQDIDRFENICLEYGFAYPYQLNNPGYLKRIQDPQKKEFFLNFLAKDLEPVLEEAKKMQSLARTKEKSAYLLDWLSRDSFMEKLQEKVNQLRSLAEEDMALSLAAAFELILQLLEEAYQIFDLDQISQEQFTDIILGALSVQIPSTIPVGLDRIRIGQLQDLMYYDAKVLFILDLTADNFPPLHAEDSFFNAKELAWIEAISEKKLPDYKTNQMLAGLVSSAALFSRTKEKIYLSTASQDQGEWASLYKLLKDQIAEDNDFVLETKLIHIEAGEVVYPDQRWLTSQRARRYLKAYNQKLRLAARNDETKDLGKNRIKISDARQEEFLLPEPSSYWQKALVDQASQSPELILASQDQSNSLTLWQNKPEKTIFLDNDIYSLFSTSRKRLSASRLELYQACPYQYFSAYILNLQERPLWTLDQRDRGSMVHAMMELALKNFEKAISQAKDSEERRHIYQVWLDTIEERGFYDELYAQAVTREQLFAYDDPITRVKDGRRIKRMIRSALIYDSYNNLHEVFVPRYFEWFFPPSLTGQDGLLPLEATSNYRPLILFDKKYQDKNIRIELSGIIDRIDTDDAGKYRLFDYKTGKKDIDFERIYYGLDLQLGLYQKVWQENNKNQKPDALAYFSFENPVARNKQSLLPSQQTRKERLIDQKLAKVMPADSKQIVAVGDYAYQEAKKTSEKIMEGDVSPRPKAFDQTKLACSYCPFKDICGFDQRLIKQRIDLLPKLDKDTKPLDLIVEIMEETHLEKDNSDQEEDA